MGNNTIDEVVQGSYDREIRVGVLSDKIDAIPAADVVHVVRCRYCFYSKENGFICTHEFGLQYAFPNSFCSNGTPRDGAKWECEE